MYQAETPLPRRDVFLLPVVGVFTILAMLVSSEIVSRIIWPQDEDDPCAIVTAGGYKRFRPNCHSVIKAAEGPWADSYLNECGYHTRASCGPKSSDTIRVAVLGSSFSFGYMNPYQDTYSALVERSLAKQCNRRLEFQNLGLIGTSLDLIDTYRRTDEALALKPDLLMLGITPFDVTKELTPQEVSKRNEPAIAAPVSARPKTGNWVRNYIADPLKGSRAVVMMQHFMYKTPRTYANLYLLYGDNADYLRQPFSTRWQQRFRNLDTILGDISARAKSAGVPMVIFIGTSIAQAALENVPREPGVDPMAFDAELTKIAARHNISVIDPTPMLKGRPDVMDLFYTVDGHFNVEGQHLLAKILEQKLVGEDFSPVKGCVQSAWSSRSEVPAPGGPIANPSTAR